MPAKPVRLTKQVLQKVCDELSQGKSLRSICENNDEFPHFRTVLRRVQDNEDYFVMYQKARAIGAEEPSDAMLDLSRQQMPLGIDPKLANAEIQRRRLEVDTLKWTFARMQPKGIRNRSEDTVTDNTITLSWGDYKPLEDKSPDDIEDRNRSPLLTIVNDGKPCDVA